MVVFCIWLRSRLVLHTSTVLTRGRPKSRPEGPSLSAPPPSSDPHIVPGTVLLMSAVAVSAVAVDISRLLEPKGSSLLPRKSLSPPSHTQGPAPSIERSPTSGPPAAGPPPGPSPYPEYSAAEYPQPAPPPGYAVARSTHEGSYPPPPLAPGGHTPAGYAHAASPTSHGYESMGPPKRRPSQEAHPLEPPAKRQSKWTPEENELIIKLRGDGMKWDDVSKQLPGRSAISCRLHYQNFLERRPDWDEEKKNKLARLYERCVFTRFPSRSVRFGTLKLSH